MKLSRFTHEPNVRAFKSYVWSPSFNIIGLQTVFTFQIWVDSLRLWCIWSVEVYPWAIILKFSVAYNHSTFFVTAIEKIRTLYRHIVCICFDNKKLTYARFSTTVKAVFVYPGKYKMGYNEEQQPSLSLLHFTCSLVFVVM